MTYYFANYSKFTGNYWIEELQNLQGHLAYFDI